MDEGQRVRWKHAIAVREKQILTGAPHGAGVARPRGAPANRLDPVVWRVYHRQALWPASGYLNGQARNRASDLAMAWALELQKEAQAARLEEAVQVMLKDATALHRHRDGEASMANSQYQAEQVIDRLEI